MANLKQVSVKYGIDIEHLKVMKTAMAQCWDGIASDWLSGFGSEEAALEEFNRDEGEMVAEATLDADMILMYGTEEYKKLAKTVFKDRTDMLRLGRDVWNARRV